MAQKTDAELTTEANVIKNETDAGDNTATRVGEYLVNDIDSKINNDKIIDEDDMSSDSATHVPTQQSVKAYVDAQVGGSGHVIEDEGTPLTQRTKLNFVGAGVTVTDDSGDDASVVTIPSATAILATTITNGDTTHAPDGNSVFDALALKADITAVVGVQDFFIPASAMWPRVTNGSSLVTQFEMTTSLFNVQALAFDQTTQEFAQFQVRLPRKWNNGTVTFAPYWTAQSGSGTVQWGLSGGAYSNDDALTVALGSEQTSDDTLIATNDLHIGPTSSAITLAGTPADADFLAFQISRNPASDTLSGDALLLGIVIFLTTDAAIDA